MIRTYVGLHVDPNTDEDVSAFVSAAGAHVDLGEVATLYAHSGEELAQVLLEMVMAVSRAIDQAAERAEAKHEADQAA
jgi:hypothetical protein